MIKFLSYNGGTLDDTILIHPNGLRQLKSQIDTLHQDNLSYGVFTQRRISDGLNIITSENVPKHPLKWQFPETPFVSYDQSDELWARPVKFGGEVEDTNIYICYLMRRPDYLKPLKLSYDYNYKSLSPNRHFSLIGCY